MCGISTIVVLPRSVHDGSLKSHDDAGRPDETSSTRQRLQSEMQESLNVIKHRGPDASGVWTSEDERIGTTSLDKKSPTKASRIMTDVFAGTQFLVNAVYRSTT